MSNDGWESRTKIFRDEKLKQRLKELSKTIFYISPWKQERTPLECIYPTFRTLWNILSALHNFGLVISMKIELI